jgi:hypothetical protein
MDSKSTFQPSRPSLRDRTALRPAHRCVSFLSSFLSFVSSLLLPSTSSSNRSTCGQRSVRPKITTRDAVGPRKSAHLRLAWGLATGGPVSAPCRVCVRAARGVPRHPLRALHALQQPEACAQIVSARTSRGRRSLLLSYCGRKKVTRRVIVWVRQCGRPVLRKYIGRSQYSEPLRPSNCLTRSVRD